jgi:hypothetical protein
MQTQAGFNVKSSTSSFLFLLFVGHLPAATLVPAIQSAQFTDAKEDDNERSKRGRGRAHISSKLIVGLARS